MFFLKQPNQCCQLGSAGQNGSKGYSKDILLAHFRQAFILPSCALWCGGLWRTNCWLYNSSGFPHFNEILLLLQILWMFSSTSMLAKGNSKIEAFWLALCLFLDNL